MTSTGTLTRSEADVKFSFPANVVTAFTDGDCWVLAREMEEQFQLPVVTAHGNHDSWIHAANLLPDGRVVDVEGVWQVDAWVARWQETLDEYWSSEAMYGTLYLNEWSSTEFNYMLMTDDWEPKFSLSDQVYSYSEMIGQQLGL